MRRLASAHPFLVGAYPVLFLYARNVEEVAATDVVAPLALALLLAALALVAVRRVVGDPAKAGLLVSAGIAFFTLYGHVWRGLEGAAFGRHRFLLPAWTIAAVAVVWWIARRRGDLAAATRGVTVAAAGLVILNVATIGLYEARAGGAGARLGGPIRLAPAPPAAPDIVYVLLDRYAGAATLEHRFGFDNTPFLDALRERGFVLPASSRANYPKSAHSIAASLNMTYLDGLAARAGRPDDWGPVYEVLPAHRLGETLTTAGYDYVHLGSWWEPTRTSPLADANLLVDPLSEFSRVLLESTMVWPVSRALHVGDRWFDFRTSQWHRVRFQFNEIPRAARRRGPTLVFAHVTMPHPPFVFRRDGAFVDEEEDARRDRRTAYLEQVRYANDELLRMVDALLEAPGEPVIVLQSDEGPIQANTARATRAQLKRKFDILNALRLPGAAAEDVPDEITPVNTFRLVLSRYLGADLPLLPDRSYVFRDKRHLYEFVDVTDDARRGG